jgi:hypothetical protein
MSVKYAATEFPGPPKNLINHIGHNCKHMKQVAKITLFIIILLICLLGIEILASKIVSTEQFNDKINISDESIEFYKSHIADVHHLRGLYNDWWKSTENPCNAIFSIVAPFRKTQNNILIQGDSWAEQFEKEISKKALTKFASEKQVGIINAGTTSYAPSVMTTQLRKLRQQFNIHPTHIIAIIDQSDIGDELCRYSVRRSFDLSNRLVSVRPEPFESNEPYKLEPFFRKQAILRSDKFALLKLFESVALKIQHIIIREKTRCKWTDIVRPLLNGISKEEEEDFISAVNRYIDEVFSDNRVKSLQIIAHPHRSHFSKNPRNRYVLYTGKLIKLALRSNKHSQKVILLDFLNQDIGSYLINPAQEIFREGDPASHLIDEIYGTKLTPRILAELEKQL